MTILGVPRLQLNLLRAGFRGFTALKFGNGEVERTKTATPTQVKRTEIATQAEVERTETATQTRVERIEITTQTQVECTETAMQTQVERTETETQTQVRAALFHQLLVSAPTLPAPSAHTLQRRSRRRWKSVRKRR